MCIVFRYFMAISAAAALMFLACEATFGENFCKWKDENGVVHYSDKCPENTDTEPVEIDAPPSPDRIEEARKRSEAVQSSLEAQKQLKTEKASEREAATSARAGQAMARREKCVAAMVDLHNLNEGEAMYFDEAGGLHDQFSFHSSSYAGKRTYISDAEHKALIEARREVVLADCVQSQDEIITRIKMLAARSDSQMCKNLYERVLKDKRFDRSSDVTELQSIENTVLEVCN